MGHARPQPDQTEEGIARYGCTSSKESTKTTLQQHGAHGRTGLGFVMTMMIMMGAYSVVGRQRCLIGLLTRGCLGWAGLGVVWCGVVVEVMQQVLKTVMRRAEETRSEVRAGEGVYEGRRRT